MARTNLTVKNIEKAIQTHNGNITYVAKSLGTSRQTIYKKIGASATLQDALAEARDTMVDNVESSLYAQALSGNTTAMIFFLKSTLKTRVQLIIQLR